MRGAARALLPLVLITAGACDQSVSLGPGVMAPDPPLQALVNADSFAVKGFTLRPRAEYTITAKLLAKRRYRLDALAPVAGWDFAVGWGALSDEAILERTRLTQGGRKMYWHLSDAPIDLMTVERSSANMHLIAATPAVAALLDQAREGVVITLQGRLVDLTDPDGRTTPTSLVRHDTGAGACEILWVETVNLSQEI